MTRPRLSDSTVEAVRLLANHYTEFDASEFTVDKQLRLVLHKLTDDYDTMERRSSKKQTFEKANALTENYSVSRGEGEGE